MNREGLTITELLIVFAIFVIIFAAATNIFVQSDRTWQLGRNLQELQQEARVGLDRVSRELRESNLKWHTNTSDCYLVINSPGDQIDFCSPVFDVNGTITGLTGVRYHVGGSDNNQLLRRTGAVDNVVAVNIDNIAGQKPFFDYTTSLYAPANCTCARGSINCTDTNCAVMVKIPTVKNQYSFSTNSSVALRNRESDLGSVEVSEIEEQ